jgi:hypothetical protein
MKFYFYLYGFWGGIKFALGLIKSSGEKIYYFNLCNDKINNVLINPALRFQVIENERQFNDIYEDYIKIKGRLLAEEDRQRIISKKELLGIIYKDNVFAGWGWIKSGPLIYGNNKVLKNGFIIHECRTLRTVRRQRVYMTLLINILNELRNKGATRVFIGAKDFNVASLAAIGKVGFTFIEEFDSGDFIAKIASYLKDIKAK